MEHRGERSEPHCGRFEHAPGIAFRVVFLWAKQCFPVLHTLSANIAREICSYYGSPDRLLIMYKGTLYAFWQRWSPYSQLKGANSDWKLIGSVLVGKHGIVMTVRTAKHQRPDIVLCTPPTTTVIVANMTLSYRAMVFDERREAVYMFAGKMQTSTNQTMNLHLPTRQKHPMATMLHARKGFGYCWHHSLVYICAGTHPTIETYSAVSNAFSLFGRFSEDVESGASFAAVSDGRGLVVISKRYISTHSEGRWCTQNRANSSEDRVFRAYGAVWRDRKVYCLERMRCTVVDLETKAERTILCHPR